MPDAYDVAIGGGVEHMGHHPMGEGVDPNPRFVSEQIVDGSALVMGSTAENLHDRFPHLTKERADAFALASQQRYAADLAGGRNLLTVNHATRIVDNRLERTRRSNHVSGGSRGIRCQAQVRDVRHERHPDQVQHQ